MRDLAGYGNRATHAPRHRARGFRLASVAVIVLGVLTNGLLISTGAVLAVSSPVARWTLDDAAGLTADDSVGTANGTLSGGAAWLTTNAAVGTGALRFDGVDDKVTVPSSSAIEPSELLLTAWVRGGPLDPPAAGEVIVEKGAFDCLGPSYGMYVAPGGIRVSFRSPNGVQLQFTATDDEAKVNLWDGAWHLLAARIRIRGAYLNAVGGTVMIDGFAEQFETVGDIVDTSTPHTSAIRYAGATSTALVVGGPVAGACGGLAFDGDIDDVRVYADPTFPSVSLMPTVATSVSIPAPFTANTGGTFDVRATVSPVPRWGTVTWDIFVAGAWAPLGSDVPDDLGRAIVGVDAPNANGTYPVRATFHGGAPYLDSTTQTTLTVTPWPTTTFLQISPEAFLPGAPIRLSASVDSLNEASTPDPAGTVKFWETTSGTPILLGTAPARVGPYSLLAEISVTTFAVGTHKVVAEFVSSDPKRAGSSSAPVSALVVKRTPTVILSNLSSTPIETNHSFVISSIVTGGAGTFATGATMTFKRVGSTTAICVVPVAPTGYTECRVPSRPVGLSQYTATYSGNAVTAAATSAVLNVNVIADTVHATGVGVDNTTFYPYVDAYRDTVAIKGTRNEPIGVTIKIYSPGGTLLKATTIASGSGAYSYAWNGRNSSGTWYAEGTYKIVQSLRDAAGTIKDYTFSVVLSKKKIYTYTKTISKAGSSMTAQGSESGGIVTYNTTSGYAKLYAPTTGTSWAGAGWELTLPAAAIYKSIYVRVYGRHSGTTGYTALGAQSFAACPYVAGGTWNEACFGLWKEIPTTSGTTLHYYQTVALTSAYKTATKVRATVSSYAGTTYIYKAQIVVTYGVLGY